MVGPLKVTDDYVNMEKKHELGFFEWDPNGSETQSLDSIQCTNVATSIVKKPCEIDNDILLILFRVKNPIFFFV